MLGYILTIILRYRNIGICFIGIMEIIFLTLDTCLKKALYSYIDIKHVMYNACNASLQILCNIYNLICKFLFPLHAIKLRIHTYTEIHGRKQQVPLPSLCIFVGYFAMWQCIFVNTCWVDPHFCLLRLDPLKSVRFQLVIGQISIEFSMLTKGNQHKSC